MPLFTRRAPHLPLAVPRPDGTDWLDARTVGRPSFDGLAFYEIACRYAFEPEAHELAEHVVDMIMPRLDTRTTAEDQPYLRKVFTTAARIGSGLGRQERGMSTPGLDLIDRRIASALWQGRRKLPAMREDWAVMGAYFLKSGYYVARTDGDGMYALLAELPPP
ncbi:MAG: hypothetical protein M3P46_00355 [Actinomycetota bacterium]|nr:hypothetical protein [Actinomycetota bacterium]